MKTSKYHLKMNTISLLACIIASWFLGNMATRFWLPMMPLMQQDLHISEALAKYTLSIYLFGKAFGMLAYGPLSEIHGRKRFMLLGLFLYVLGSIICMIAFDIKFLLFGRLIEGLGVSATLFLVRAIINDRFKKKNAVSVFGYVFTITGFIITLLPIAGGYIALYENWRLPFYIMAVYGALLFVAVYYFMPETQDKKVYSHYWQVLKTYPQFLSHPIFLGFVLCSSLMVIGESAFNTASPFLLIKTYHLSTSEYGQLMSLPLAAHFIGALVCAKMAKRQELTYMLGLGVKLLVSSIAITLLAIALKFNHTATIMLPMLIYYFGTGFIMTTAAAGIVQPFPQLIATVTATSMFIEKLLSASGSMLASIIKTNTPWPLLITIGIVSVCSLISWYGLINPYYKRLSDRQSAPLTH